MAYSYSPSASFFALYEQARSAASFIVLSYSLADMRSGIVPICDFLT